MSSTKVSGEAAAFHGSELTWSALRVAIAKQPGNSGGALVDEHRNAIGIVSGKLSAKATLLTSGALPENVNYAVKSSFLLGFLESVPEVAAKLPKPNTTDVKFDDVVERAQKAAAPVLVY